MSKGRPRKCLICNESILEGDSVPFKGRYAHQKCFNIAMKTLQKDKIEKLTKAEEQKKRGKSSKPKAELKSNISEEEYKQKQSYYNYIRQITNQTELGAKTYALSEDYIKRYNFTFSSMYQTLIYLHEIIEKELTGDVIGIIPYYHTEAQNYYTDLVKTQKTNQDIDPTNMYQKKIVQIKTKPRNIKQIDVKSI